MSTPETTSVTGNLVTHDYPADTPVRVVVDCSDRPAQAAALGLIEEGIVQARNGDTAAGAAKIASGQQMLEAAETVPPPITVAPLTADELAQRDADAKALADAAAAAAAEETAAAWIELRMTRDRWLDQLQIVFDHADAVSTRPLSQKMIDGTDANAAGWQTWRQEMRDLPQQAGLDPVAAVSAAKEIHSTADEWPAPWPQPPAAPVVHLT